MKKEKAMDIEEKLKEIIKDFDESMDVDSFTRESSLKDDLELSSVSMLYLAVAIEDEFEIDLSNTNLGEIKTIGDLIDAIESLK